MIEEAQAQGYRYVSDAEGLSTVGGGKPVLSLFTPSTMSLEWSGPAASTGKDNAPVPCTEDQRPANEPSLAAMTRRAIDLLEEKNKKGFFLQVEGADGQTLSLTYGTAGYGGPGAAPRRCRRASSTPVPRFRSGPAARAGSRCSAPATTPTCSTRSAGGGTSDSDGPKVGGRRSSCSKGRGLLANCG